MKILSKILLIPIVLGCTAAVDQHDIGFNEQAISGGDVDDQNQFPYVGSMLFVVGPPGGEFAFSACSGSLIEPDVFLTAGHCTFVASMLLEQGHINAVKVSFDTYPHAPDATHLEVAELITHPQFVPRFVGTNGYDIGAIRLADPVTSIEPVAIAEEGMLDNSDLNQNSVFTLAGYGATLVEFSPPTAAYFDERRHAESSFSSLRKDQFKINGNPFARDSGSVCYGDSGGPALLYDEEGNPVVAGITAWGDKQCVANAVFRRIDIASSLDFIAGL